MCNFMDTIIMISNIIQILAGTTVIYQFFYQKSTYNIDRQVRMEALQEIMNNIEKYVEEE